MKRKNIKMLRLFSVAAFLFITTNALFANANNIIIIKNKDNNKGNFTLQKDSGAVANGDGAKIVVYKSAIITATNKSSLTTFCRNKKKSTLSYSPVVNLEDGTFHIYVGTKSVIFQLGETQIITKQTELIVSKIKSDWIIQNKPIIESGFAKILVKTPSMTSLSILPIKNDKNNSKIIKLDKSSKPSGDQAHTSNVQTQTSSDQTQVSDDQDQSSIVLESGIRLKLKASLKPVKASKIEAKRFGDFLAKLFFDEQKKNFAVLTPTEIEDPSDFKIAAATSSLDVDDLEIEDIELEIGCVEVCVD